MSDGLVLKPDRAATNIDSNILAKATARATGSPEPGEVQSTIATIGNFTYAYVLAADTNVSLCLQIQRGKTVRRST